MKKYCFDIAAFIISWMIGCEREIINHDWIRGKCRLLGNTLKSFF